MPIIPVPKKRGLGAGLATGGTVVARGATLPTRNLGAGLGRNLTPYNFRAPSAPSVPYQPVSSNAGAGSGATPGAAAPTNYLADPNLLNDEAGITQQYGIGKARIAAASSQDKIALSRALDLLGQQKPKDILNAQEAANNAGLLHSGHLGQNLGDIETSYAQRGGDLSLDSALSGGGGELGQNWRNAEENRAIDTRDIEGQLAPAQYDAQGNLVNAGGTASQKALQAAKDRIAATAGQQALIDAITGGGASGGDAAPAAPAGPINSPGNATPIAQQYLSAHPGGSIKQVGNKIYGLSSKNTWYIIGTV